MSDHLGSIQVSTCLKSFSATCCILCLCACSVGHELPYEHKSGIPTQPFVVAVVGDGVPSPEPANRDHPLNNAQGRAMWTGAKAAFDGSPECKQLRNYAELRPLDDGGSVEVATDIAMKVRSDPRTIAVIGHATSGTTRAAAWAYAEAHIPLLMPIATSPYADLPPKSMKYLPSPLLTCFRLPPNDDKFQVAAVTYLARKLQSARVYLLRDVSEDSGDYSGPLFTGLEKYLNHFIVRKRTIDRDKDNMFLIAESIKGYKADTVVLTGYGTTAQELLNALRSTYKETKSSRPRIILTDGCKTEEVDPSGFETYVTFPLPEVKANMTPQSGTAELQILENAIAGTSKQSYEIYGYDAVLMLGRAFNNCTSTQSVRDCIITQLRNPDNSVGVLSPYEFDQYGENQEASYYIYTSRIGETLSSTFHEQFNIPPAVLKDELAEKRTK